MRADLVLVGFGNVGRRFVRLLDERRDLLQRELDLEPRVIGIATRGHGSVFNALGLDGNRVLREREQHGTVRDGSGGPAPDVDELIGRLATSSAPIRVVVETTPLSIADRGEPAIAHIAAALDSGCDAITANKGPVAFAYRQLRERAAAAERSFLFEGAVMDGVPIFNLVRETLPGVAIRGFRGIVNSTTNHIIAALEDGEGFAPALARMQAEGIAEADPSLDIDGWDAAAKTAALANVLMDAGITPDDVERTGITPESAEPARAARDRGHRLKLVAAAARSPDGRLVATVRPEELEAHDLLAQVHGKANALILQTDLLGDIAMHQLGAGLTMTAFALLTDLITVRRRAG